MIVFCETVREAMLGMLDLNVRAAVSETKKQVKHSDTKTKHQQQV